MEDDELDAELLAVTDGQKRARRPAKSGSSGSDGAEYEGIADSDDGDDDDDEMLDDAAGSDDDDDDDEYGLGDDDEEFGSKGSRKKKAPKQSKKKPSSKGKATKRRPRSSEKRRAKEGKDSMSEDEEDEFTYKYNQQGYGDAQDFEDLDRMNEFDRELKLEERIDARNTAFMLWKKKREMARSEAGVREKRTARSSGRTKQSSKSNALQALAEDKRKKSARPVDLDVSDADSEPDASGRRHTSAEADRTEKAQLRDVERDDSEGGLKYSDLLVMREDGTRRTTPLYLRREALVQVSQQPYFERAVVGLFCKIRGMDRYDDSYILCRIGSVQTGKIYEIGDGLVTNWYLNLLSGKTRRQFEIRLTSGSAPLEAEFDDYCRRLDRADADLPRRDEVNKLLRKSRDLVFDKKGVATDTELKKHVASTELLYPARVNWTQKLTEAKTELEIKKQDTMSARDRGDTEMAERCDADIEELEKRIVEVRRFEEKYVLKSVRTNAEVFHTLAKRNMALNNSNERLNASRENLESRAHGTNPFARFDTTGQSYFSIPKQDDKEQPTAEKSTSLETVSDWRCLASTWDPAGKRRKISEHAMDVAYDVPLPSLDVFDGDGRGEQREKKYALLPPMIDATYGAQACAQSSLPAGAKLLSFEEWSRQRAG